VREAIAVEKAGLRTKRKKTSDFPVPKELSEKFRKVPRFKRAFDALTPGRQRGYLYHFWRGQAIGDAERANRKSDARDIRRQRVSRETLIYGFVVDTTITNCLPSGETSYIVFGPAKYGALNKTVGGPTTGI